MWRRYEVDRITHSSKNHKSENESSSSKRCMYVGWLCIGKPWKTFQIPATAADTACRKKIKQETSSSYINTSEKVKKANLLSLCVGKRLCEWSDSFEAYPIYFILKRRNSIKDLSSFRFSEFPSNAPCFLHFSSVCCLQYIVILVARSFALHFYYRLLEHFWACLPFIFYW